MSIPTGTWDPIEGDPKPEGVVYWHMALREVAAGNREDLGGKGNPRRTRYPFGRSFGTYTTLGSGTQR